MSNKPWHAIFTPTIGKSIRYAAKMLKHGGSAFPGKIVEQIDAGFLARTLSALPYGVVLVSGTNGKTTTTRMVASMFESLGLRVFTNPTGSNFTRGVVSALLQEVTLSGVLHADIAVLELDEAYAVHFVKQIKPRYTLLLNVMRDQLDRFGEIDNTAKLLKTVAENTTDTIILNREDPRISAISNTIPEQVHVSYFGLDPQIASKFPTDDTLHDRQMHKQHVQTSVPKHDADVELVSFAEHSGTFRINGEEVSTSLRINGMYNIFNAAAAAATIRAVLRENPPSTQELLQALSNVTPAFGRGEVIEVNGQPVELLLVKNPIGFSLALQSFPPDNTSTMIAIGDEYADGRDMSWLWDVDFTSLHDGVRMVTGARAWDMTLRLAYDQVPVVATNTNIEEALHEFLVNGENKPKHIFCTYTTMLHIRALLSQYAHVEDVGVGK
ncbi:MAG: MurT ligase domain-containing protein [Bifidobacteriaceae bacterium]|nr:MurT ligase domain-containing protein [Bifidobacteriaceae bacterium]